MMLAPFLDAMIRGGIWALLALWSWLLLRDHWVQLAARTAVAMNACIAAHVPGSMAPLRIGATHRVGKPQDSNARGNRRRHPARTSGFAFFPRWWLTSRWTCWISTTTHHGLPHNGSFNHNFGLCFTGWDKWMGTENPRYTKGFAEVVGRGDARSPALAEAVMGSA